MNRIFDPDLQLSFLEPENITFPTWAKVHVDMLPPEIRNQLPEYMRQPTQVGAEQIMPYALFTAWNGDPLSPMVKLWPQAPSALPQHLPVWIPWVYISPDLTVLPN